MSSNADCICRYYKRTANAVASQRGINKVIAQVLPEQKEKQSLNFKIKKKR
jgi:cation transport ATPase